MGPVQALTRLGAAEEDGVAWEGVLAKEVPHLVVA
jgi:hypothetical protein